ncbi:hypothetical protein WICMUC_000737 [Wickerhamomyces mucosus]|uniref:Thioesterase domain-containing protein n=1 Tax=Wickerhamomyces mucosus TaxID=1378264 RepID=A0A9P8TI75_9ASCO|nr:hypothetical protein WICMUC_000737 [Wickerhamomyces mucosus]
MFKKSFQYQLFKRFNSSSKVGFIPPQSITTNTTNTTKDNNTNNNNNNNKTSNLPLYIASFLLGAGIAQFFPLSEIAKFWISEHLPQDSLQSNKFKQNLENDLKNLKIYNQLINDSNYESIRAWNYIDSNHIVMTQDSLSVPGGFAIKPILFFNKSKPGNSISIIHVGEKLTGYPFIIHGGILATIIDEILKRSSYSNPLKYKANLLKTENLQLQYKFPTFANQFLILKTELLSNGEIEGKLTNLNGKTLVIGKGKYQPILDI